MYYIPGIPDGAVIPDEIPNTETINAMRKLENEGSEPLKKNLLILI